MLLPPESGEPKGDHVPGAWGSPSPSATPSPTTPPSSLLIGVDSDLDFEVIEAIVKYAESTWAADPPSPVLPPCTPALVPPPTPRLRAWDLDHPVPRLRAQDLVDPDFRWWPGRSSPKLPAEDVSTAAPPLCASPETSSDPQPLMALLANLQRRERSLQPPLSPAKQLSNSKFPPTTTPLLCESPELMSDEEAAPPSIPPMQASPPPTPPLCESPDQLDDLEAPTQPPRPPTPPRRKATRQSPSDPESRPGIAARVRSTLIEKLKQHTARPKKATTRVRFTDSEGKFTELRPAGASHVRFAVDERGMARVNRPPESETERMERLILKARKRELLRLRRELARRAALPPLPPLPAPTLWPPRPLPRRQRAVLLGPQGAVFPPHEPRRYATMQPRALSPTFRRHEDDDDDWEDEDKEPETEADWGERRAKELADAVAEYRFLNMPHGTKLVRFAPLPAFKRPAPQSVILDALFPRTRGLVVDEPEPPAKAKKPKEPEIILTRAVLRSLSMSAGDCLPPSLNEEQRGIVKRAEVEAERRRPAIVSANEKKGKQRAQRTIEPVLEEPEPEEETQKFKGSEASPSKTGTNTNEADKTPANMTIKPKEDSEVHTEKPTDADEPPTAQVEPETEPITVVESANADVVTEGRSVSPNKPATHSTPKPETAGLPESKDDVESEDEQPRLTWEAKGKWKAVSTADDETDDESDIASAESEETVTLFEEAVTRSAKSEVVTAKPPVQVEEADEPSTEPETDTQSACPSVKSEEMAPPSTQPENKQPSTPKPEKKSSQPSGRAKRRRPRILYPELIETGPPKPSLLHRLVEPPPKFPQEFDSELVWNNVPIKLKPKPQWIPWANPRPRLQPPPEPESDSGDEVWYDCPVGPAPLRGIRKMPKTPPPEYVPPSPAFRPLTWVPQVVQGGGEPSQDQYAAYMQRDLPETFDEEGNVVEDSIEEKVEEKLPDYEEREPEPEPKPEQPKEGFFQRIRWLLLRRGTSVREEAKQEAEASAET